MQAQAYIPFKGIQHKKHPKIAIVNANIQTSPEQLLKEATLLINGNIIQDVGTEIKVPEDFIIIDLEGKYIYPSFVELYSNYGCDTTYQAKRNQLNYWNSSIHPEHNVAQHFKSTKKEAERLRSMGFGTAQGHLQDGISRGVSAVYTLEAGQSDLRLLKSKGMAFYSLNKGQSKMPYPTSLMGSIALLRQSFYDALWYEENMDKGIPKNNSLEALANQWKQKQCIELGSYKKSWDSN